jgi:hypothetical protein
MKIGQENTRQGESVFSQCGHVFGHGLQEWRVFSPEIRTQSGKHRHQGGVSITS